jgi:chemotaxis-related protein WspD
LRELLGIESPQAEAAAESASSAGAKQRFIVAEQDQNRWVFPVDEVEGVHRVPADAMNNLPHTVEKSPRYYSQAIFSHDNKNVGVLSGTRLSQALERTVR